MATARTLIEYIWKNGPRVKVTKAAMDLNEDADTIRYAASKQLWDVIRLVGTQPEDFLTTVTKTLEDGVEAAAKGGSDIDAELPLDPRAKAAEALAASLVEGSRKGKKGDAGEEGGSGGG